MYTLFVAVDLSESIRTRLEELCGGLPGVNWLEPEYFHLTVQYIGAVDGGMLQDLSASLSGLKAPAFAVKLHSVGLYPLKGEARSVVALADKNEALRVFRAKIEQVLKSRGLKFKRQRYNPHVTLGRFGQAFFKSIDHERLAAYLANGSLIGLGPFEVDRFCLFSSVRTSSGRHYEREATFYLQKTG